MTELTDCDWDTGFDLDDGPVPQAVPPAGPRDVLQGVPLGDVPPEPIGAGRWVEAPDGTGPDRDGGLADVIARLTALAKGSPLLGGSALAAELANSRPDTWAGHWRHVTRHPARPEGTWAGAGWTAGHLAVTGPLKLTGQAMTVTGGALSWAGKRANRASDNFASAVIFIVLAAAIAAVIVIGAGQVIAYLA